MKAFLLFLLLAQGASHANPATDSAISARTQAMQSMQAFHPQDVIPKFTETPRESRLQPNAEDNDKLLQQETSVRLNQEDTARFVITEEQRRAKITPNPKSADIAYADRLIEGANNAIQPGCYKEPVPCEEHVVEKVCEELSAYAPLVCQSHKVVHLNRVNHPEVHRIFAKNVPPVNLTTCEGALKGFCSQQQLIPLHPRCEHLEVVVLMNGKSVTIVKKPTCADPTVGIDDAASSGLFRVSIQVVEHWSDDDGMDASDCRMKDTIFCVPDLVNTCIEPNQTKIIQGVPVTRACWGHEETYQCLSNTTTTCTPFLDQGCSNTASTCETFTGEHCDVMSRTFQCTNKICFPDKEVCSPSVGCADGSCDLTFVDVSDDINEGVSRLGTVAGTAQEVATNQVQSQQPGIFRGGMQECEKYMWGMRDCCTDDGFLDGIINCPRELQVLQQAKREHRVAYVGHYKPHRFSTTRYRYCVFPTKLAGIVQIQGRFAQLGIGFGSVWHPDCRGVTPEELERINFKALDLSEMVAELVGKKNLPQDATIDAVNSVHVNAMHDKGRAHD
ncbi:MAG: conjugal transfer protein TraN [Legionellaceae bacterium]|nr:conjugal transfer protein TraN [Legionellaceae bacterium]